MHLFIRSDLARLAAYTPHPEAVELSIAMDRLDTNECPYDLPLELKHKLMGQYQTQIEANRYPDGGHGALKAAIAAYVAESVPNDSLLDAPWISVGNGSDELIRSLLIATCLGGEGSILVADPTFSMYAILAQTLGIPIVNIGRDDQFAMDLAAAQGAVARNQAAEPPVRVVFVVHPNSPTGNVLTLAEQDWLVSLPEDILVVIDEAYFEFSQTSLVSLLPQHPNWVILRTFSKAFRLAAHRIGYAIAHPDLIQVLEKVRLPYNLPAISQAAALLALNHRQSLLATLPEVWAERDRLYQNLKSYTQLRHWPSRANFLYIQSPERADLGAELKALGTSVREAGGGLRITVGTPTENDHTLARLHQILR
ncbi:histidinol-phosphate transaminase [Synechococcales cyanobacterium C]|uniref:Histidinol-phosphate aminotransferase n=1 Tax=Petrachloros mirabilis ULC683 TaxID=2781853 RepID=A0A8K2A9C7_9CYAN|nr:histidinol-phosphate transaminase [Petrachloros mirabilis]NCJ07910.1 histidinol-phosphate transaminase [Petrachloros mirabilis ULC683]